MVDGAETVIVSVPVIGELETLMMNGEIVSDCSLPISKRTLVVWPRGFTDPVIVVTVDVNGD